MNSLVEGFATGYACLSARADLLDRINVFPVADNDTGANLRITLAPLRCCGPDRAVTAARLIRGATGNSGNIAAPFFHELVQASSLDDLPVRVAAGRAQAWRAVAEPRGGTMLSVFDALAEILDRTPLTTSGCVTILATLRETVLATTETLADLRQAGVVDAGALGMYVFFDGFLRTLAGDEAASPSLFTLFPGRLAVAGGFSVPSNDGRCVDAVIRPVAGQRITAQTMDGLGDSVVLVPGAAEVKLHIHTTEPQRLHDRLTGLGEVINWHDESLQQPQGAMAGGDRTGSLHIMTDAAGSLPRHLARDLAITLLDSYIVTGDVARPESLCDPETIYALMRQGHKVTTAQASRAERHACYQSVCEQFGTTLYLCVGSVYTGNYATALAWKEEQDPQGCLQVLDTGAASGRLAVIALLTGRRAGHADSAAEVRVVARRLLDLAQEYIFVDCLQYLVAGGRVSRAKGFIGDLLHMKPVISPTAGGVRKVGTVRNQKAQLAFALAKVRTRLDSGKKALLLLQYTDNKIWVEETVCPQMQSALPEAEILVVPLSLTSGVHLGPGAWSLAFAQDD